MGKIERALAECKERCEALEVGNDRLREKITVLEQDKREWCDLYVKAEKLRKELEQERNRLRDALEDAAKHLDHSPYENQQDAFDRALAVLTEEGGE